MHCILRSQDLDQIFDWICQRVQAEVSLAGPDVPCVLILEFHDQPEDSSKDRSLVTLYALAKPVAHER